MGWAGLSFPRQSRAGGRLAFSPLVLPGTSAPPDSSRSPVGWCLPEAALGKRGAGAEAWTGTGSQGGGASSCACAGVEGQSLPWKGRAKAEVKPLAWAV